jgi:hypothetical protein
MAVILAAQEADIRRIMVWSQLGKEVLKTPSEKRADRVSQGIDPEFKPQYRKKKKKKKRMLTNHLTLLKINT